MGWGGYLVVVGGVFEQEDFFSYQEGRSLEYGFLEVVVFFFYCFSYRFFKLFIRDTEKNFIVEECYFSIIVVVFRHS